jgi:DNA ligase-1
VRFAELVNASGRVGAVSGRKAKAAILADLLRRLHPAEADVAIAFLSGVPRQPRLGVGAAAIRAARPDAAASGPTLELADVDVELAVIAGLSGPGSSSAKVERLRRLLARGTAEEQDFLVRLLFGELRQGALEGILVDALAGATGVAAARLRRAATVAGNLGPVAAAALARGEAGLAPFAAQIFRPIQPMLASPVDGLDEALARLPEAHLEAKLDGARIQVHKRCPRSSPPRGPCRCAN